MYSKRAIFLDRDGVLIKAPKYKKKPHSIRKFKDIKILKNVKKSLSILREKFLLIMITNQPDVSRKKIKKKTVIRINQFLKKILELNDVYVCYHDDIDLCECRKPKPGMILKAKKKWKINLKKSYLIGDRNSDIEAGKRAGCKNFFINYDYNENLPKKKNCIYIKTLSEAISKIK
jgi:D-glycero-D-manno-heptose 1,7-bisphosphate phosphatase